MKRLFSIVILVVMFVGLALLALSDTVVSSGETAAPNNEAAGSIGKTGNSSASATITITMYTGDAE